MSPYLRLCVFALLVSVVPSSIRAQESVAVEATDAGGQSFLQSLKWLEGPATGVLDEFAQVQVPDGYVFLQGDDTRTLMSAMGNPPTQAEVGLLAPTNLEWFVVFEFDPIGYVKDDEKDSLDAAAMLDSMKAGTEESNKLRQEMGAPAIHIVDWHTPPFYNAATHNLEWATRLKADGDEGEFVNHNVRILGRKGVMRVTLVADASQITALQPVLAERLAQYEFQSGQKYAEYRQGDQLAKIGLAALVTGGAAAVALKTGLLQKFWKVIVVAVIGVGAFFKRMFSGKSRE